MKGRVVWARGLTATPASPFTRTPFLCTPHPSNTTPTADCTPSPRLPTHPKTLPSPSSCGSTDAMAPPASVSRLMLNQIFEAASDGNLHRFKLLVMLLDMDRGSLKDVVEALRAEDAGMLNGFSVLHVAAVGGQLEMCRYLVEDLAVDVNLVDDSGRTPLSLAILSKNAGCVMYLLDHGANPNKSCHDGIFPLHQATGLGNCEMVDLLLAKGAYVDPEARCGTPLHVAATKDHDGVMKILLDHNADVNKTANGKTPMIAAIDTVSRKCMRLLYKAGADRRGALAYATENLLAAKVVSSDFVKCILEDAESNRIVPSDEPVVKQKTREGGFNTLARYAFKEKDFESAEGCYSVIIALDPDDATAFSNRSLCWLLMGDGGKALIDADECRKRRPDWPKACYRQGAALMLLEDYQKACERFSEGLKLDPGNAEMEDALRKASDEYKKMS